MTQDIRYEIRVSRKARGTRLTVHPDGRVVVTKPAHVSQILVTQFIDRHTEWIKKKIDHFKNHPAPLLARHSIRDYKSHKEMARVLVHNQVHFFSTKYGFACGSIRIGNQKSRWGSCSKRGNLNFNYKIVFLPKEIQDYIVVHELCHLKEFNHSVRFWALVEKEIPNWQKLRKELKKY